MVPPAAKMVSQKLAALGWSHVDLAKALRERGVSVAEGLVSRWLSGKRSPDRVRSAAIQELFPDVTPKLWTKPQKKRAA